MNLLLCFAIMLFSGLLLSRLIKFLKLPDVTGYLIAGLIIGPALCSFLSKDTVSSLNIISDIALGFIAFTIGGEFKISYFKRVGATPIVIAFFESVVAVILVVLGLLLIGCELPFALVLGSIAAATAPAATVMIIKQYKAKGPVTETLLSVVALDDAVALIVFGFAVAAAKSLSGVQETSLVMSILDPIFEVLLSVGIGAVIGFIYTFVLKFFKAKSDKLCLAIAVVLITSAVASILSLSALLMCMTVGAIFTNLSKESGEVYKQCDSFTSPIFMMFFVVSGASLDLSILPSIGLIGIVYVLIRVAGKIFGAYIGAKIMKAQKEVCRYLGPALIPQAGVAIGLTFIAQTTVPDYADTIRAVVLCGTLIYELVGPVVSKITLQKAGEIEKGL